MNIEQELNRRLDPSNRKRREDFLEYVPKIECVDGLKMSVQASAYHYCTPRDSDGPWSMVEIGYPNQRIEELMPYAEDESEPTSTVYGYVPIEIIVKIIEAHGGFK